LADLDPDASWCAATVDERRVLVEEVVEEVALFPDHEEEAPLDLRPRRRAADAAS
jgi:hypothetical protein